MHIKKNISFIDAIWDKSIIPTLIEYIRIPNKSPLFDPDWEKHGFMQNAVKLMTAWCEEQAIEDMTLEVITLKNRTPLIYIEIPGDSDQTILLYGHYDKQPEMNGWEADLGPWQPVLRGDKLYGRGGADDGYAIFASLAAIKALKAQNIPHSRCIILIEGCEESGSYDLPHYIEALKERIGHPALVICLDSGCGNYEQLWVTTSLRGLVGGILNIEILSEGIHSGLGSGIVPSCQLVLRQLLDRIEDKTNGTITLKGLTVDIPPERRQQASHAAEILGEKILHAFPFKKGVRATHDTPSELILNRTWRPALSLTGAEGLPLLKDAGNVTLPTLRVKLSMRLPPTLDAMTAATLLKNTLEMNPPFEANIHFQIEDMASGWDAPAEFPWLAKAIQKASTDYFGHSAIYSGEGGTIPFMGMLGKEFPEAQFLITGLLGPGSNAHGPNEFLHIPTGKKLTACVSQVIADFYEEHCIHGK